MSQDNLEAFREGIEAFNRRDIEGVLRGFDPDIRFEHRLAALQGSFVGAGEVRGWLTDVFDHFASGHIDCTDIRDLGDRVLALGTVHGTGNESGAEAKLPYAVVARFKDGVVVEFIDYGDRRQALEAVGLSE